MMFSRAIERNQQYKTVDVSPYRKLMLFVWLEENSDQVKHYLMNFGENPPKRTKRKKT